MSGSTVEAEGADNMSANSVRSEDNDDMPVEDNLEMDKEGLLSTSSSTN